MKLKIALTISLIAFATMANTKADVLVFDLSSDWSDTINPSGVWSYNQGASPLPHVPDLSAGSIGFNAIQPAWIPSNDVGNFLPAWFKLTADYNEEMFLGDVIVHTTDDANGSSSGPANVTWTSPVSGTAHISGAVWMGRDIERSNHWRIYVGGVIATKGDIASGDVFSRALPFDFATGTGGATALTEIPVAVGTVVMLQFDKTSVFGDFVGVKLHVDVVPEPTLVPNVVISPGIKLRWQTQSGKTYQPQYSYDLNAWLNLGSSLSGDGQIKELLDPAESDTKKFYRLQIQ